MNLDAQIFQSIAIGDLDALSRLVGRDEPLRNGPNDFGSWLHCASTEGHLPIVKYLVENGADVNRRGGTSDAGPIKYAVFGGHLDVMKYLLAHGAKLDVSTPNRNPMFSAISNGHIEIVRFLLDSGIDPHVVYRSVTGNLKNGLSYAQERGENEIEDLLVKAGCRLPIEGVNKPVSEPDKIYEPTFEDSAHDEIMAHLAELFGPVDSLAMQEIVPAHDQVHVAIHVSRPNDRHRCLSLFTIGMSDRPMNVPDGQEAYQYAELVMFLPATWPHPRDKVAAEDSFWPFEWLRKVAYYPHLNKTWLGGPLTIISSDEPPMPLGPNTKQTCLLLIADFSELRPLVLRDGRRVRFYTVLPIYTDERNFERKHGIASLLQRLRQHGFAEVVSVDRASVTSK